MRKSLKKAEVWLYTFFALLGIYISTLIFAKEQLEFIGSAVIYALIALGSMYGIVNVADNGIKGKYYSADLDRRDECGSQNNIIP